MATSKILIAQGGGDIDLVRIGLLVRGEDVCLLFCKTKVDHIEISFVIQPKGAVIE